MYRIAVIEDDTAIAEMYEYKLQNSGFDVRIASDGQRGLNLIHDFKPSLLLLDLNMPVMNGDEMLRQLRATRWGADIRVIILTNISKSEAPMGLRFLSVDRYIVKAHTTPAEVVRITKEVLGLHHSR